MVEQAKTPGKDLNVKNKLSSELREVVCSRKYVFDDVFKERVHSEMKISLIKKGILVTVPIRFISFRLFYFS